MEAQQISPTPLSSFGVPDDNTLLIVDDDRAFLARLARAMETRGFEVEAAASVERRQPRSRRVCRRFGAGPRPLPWSTCVSTTATAST
jgi:hypothetical protein